MEHQFFTWGNFLTWAICSIFIYLSLNFRLYMIFHHPGRKLKARVRDKAAERRKEVVRDHGQAPGALPISSRDPECLQGSACFAKTAAPGSETYRRG